MSHFVTLNALEPGEYVYRVVSRASPATVSPEHAFTVSRPQALAQGEILGASFSPPLPDETAVQSGDNEGEERSEEGPGAAGTTTESNLANVFSAAGTGGVSWWLIFLIVLALLAVYFIGKRRAEFK